MKTITCPQCGIKRMDEVENLLLCSICGTQYPRELWDDTYQIKSRRSNEQCQR